MSIIEKFREFRKRIESKNFYFKAVDLSRSVILALAAMLLLFMQSAYSSAINEKRNGSNGADTVKFDENMIIPVLMYHHFAEEVTEDLAKSTITPEEFEEHLSYFKENGYNFIALEDLYKYIKFNEALPQNPIVITIDDGYESNYTLAYPLLEKYNAKASISVVVSNVGKTPGSFPHFDWEQAREMEESGLVNIYSHGLNHTPHNLLSREELIDSVSAAQAELENNLGPRTVKVFTYPYGTSTEETRQLLRDELGFEMQLTGFDELVTHNTDLSDIKRLNITHQMTGSDIADFINEIKGKMSQTS